MRVATVKYCDIANGEGVRTSLFVSGCRHRCSGCFNEVAWDFDYGAPYTEETAAELLNSLRPSYIAGLTVLGGEPLEPENQPEVLALLQKVKAELPQKTVWVYSGFTLEELLGESRAHTPVVCEILALVDVLVDGRFVEAKKDISLVFRGSSNQRVLNLKETLRRGEPVLWQPSAGRAIQ